MENNFTEETKREPEIVVVMKELEKRTESLNVSISRLESRLSVVLRQELPQEDERKIDQGFNSELAQNINNTIKNLNYQEIRVSGIIDRLEI